MFFFLLSDMVIYIGVPLTSKERLPCHKAEERLLKEQFRDLKS